MVEAPDDRGIGLVSCPWRVEMKYLANKAPRSRHYIVGCCWLSVKIGEDPAIASRNQAVSRARVDPKVIIPGFISGSALPLAGD